MAVTYGIAFSLTCCGGVILGETQTSDCHQSFRYMTLSLQRQYYVQNNNI